MFRSTSMSVAGALRRASIVRRKANADGDTTVSEPRGRVVRLDVLPSVIFEGEYSNVLC
jgi:hypothetical protein